MPLFGTSSVKKLEAEGDVPGLIRALGHQKSGARAPAVEALGRIGAPAVDPLIAAFKDWDMREAAAEALGQMGAPALEPLIGALKRGDRDVRQYAAVTLGQIGNAMGVVPLIAALNDRGMLVREAAAEALVRIGGPATEALTAALKDRGVLVSEAAAEALVMIGAPCRRAPHRGPQNRNCARGRRRDAGKDRRLRL
jgi:HEAT repeat protein